MPQFACERLFQSVEYNKLNTIDARHHRPDPDPRLTFYIEIETYRKKILLKKI